jgi:FeS assembly SUF system protein
MLFFDIYVSIYFIQIFFLGGRMSLDLKESVIDVLKKIFDPEIPVNIYELGLIYKVEADGETGKVIIEMTLTSPNCPVAESLPQEVLKKVIAISGVTDVNLSLVWDPPWDPSKISDSAKLQLNIL